MPETTKKQGSPRTARGSQKIELRLPVATLDTLNAVADLAGVSLDTVVGVIVASRLVIDYKQRGGA